MEADIDLKLRNKRGIKYLAMKSRYNGFFPANFNGLLELFLDYTELNPYITGGKRENNYI